MNHIPDLVAYPVEEAVSILKDLNVKINVVESYGKSFEKTEDVRVVRQKILTANEIELIISFF
ncbi:PASTA domain-containing protein [Alkaliphilus transvaalensis]|uniref:PASTA domain-containing protein n=1 Tax=Alkaliphilus transvaalensis TaxID=114628 RepID=UPI00047B014F|nr:PASTA domain-containing protein [Alkaliphilus transvaalensis]